MILTLLTDYGQGDEFVGVCHGVIRTIAPEAAIVDVTHGIPRHGVRHGALVMRNALPYLPVGVHVAVVDPQVGTERRAVAQDYSWRRVADQILDLYAKVAPSAFGLPPSSVPVARMAVGKISGRYKGSQP